jgi:hypothetical protein
MESKHKQAKPGIAFPENLRKAELNAGVTKSEQDERSGCLCIDFW